MDKTVVVFGYGAVGRAIVAALVVKGYEVRVAQRSAPPSLPPGASFVATDLLDGPAVLSAFEGARQAVLAAGFPYEGALWQTAWPKAMTHVLAAAHARSVRVVFIDNLYMYGPQTAPLTEDMPLTHFGKKPAARAAITRLWQADAAAGRVRFAALRAPDFHGPGVGAQSQLGAMAFGALARGRRAMLIAPPDTPHAFAYVPDFARGAVTLLEAPDDAYGQAWHLPTAPIATPREIIALGAAALGVRPRISSLPLWSLPALGVAVPIFRELSEMRFQFDRPYHVDSRKFERRFWSDPTPHATAARATALSFRLGD